jgi:cytochrome c oxidase subunit 1
MPRRIQSYPASLGLSFWNLMSTVGAFIIAVSVLVFLVNAIASFRTPKQMVADPWDARTLEWLTTSPPPPHNFDEIPVVHALDDLWHRKYAESEGGRVVPVAAGGSGGPEPAPDEAHRGEHDGGHDGAYGGGHGIHLPGPSYYPILASLGLPVIGYGLIFDWWIVGVGLAILLAGFFGWVLEPSAE